MQLITEIANLENILNYLAWTNLFFQWYVFRKIDLQYTWRWSSGQRVWLGNERFEFDAY